MKPILVIDDQRIFTDKPGVMYAKTSSEALRILKDHAKKGFKEVYFDYDLGGSDTTEPIIKYLETQYYLRTTVPIDHAIVHSMNPVGGAMLYRELSKMYPTTRTDPLQIGLIHPVH